MLDQFSTDGPRILYCGTSKAGKQTNMRCLARMMPGNKQDSFEQVIIGSSHLLRYTILPTNEIVASEFFTMRPAEGPIAIYALLGSLSTCKIIEELLASVQAVVFISDSKRTKRASNIKQMQSLQTVLDAVQKHESSMRQKPLVIQYNKWDLEAKLRLSKEELEKDINWSDSPAFEASALTGNGAIATIAAAVTVATRGQGRA